MTIPAPRLADPFETDPEALAWLRDTIHDLESSRDWGRDVNLSRLEWFVRERIALGIEAGLKKREKRDE